MPDSQPWTPARKSSIAVLSARLLRECNVTATPLLCGFTLTESPKGACWQGERGMETGMPLEVSFVPEKPKRVENDNQSTAFVKCDSRTDPG